MGARIEAVHFEKSHKGIFGRGSIKLASTAAKECLKKANREASEVDLLINAGVFRDDNIGEPAIASLIQQNIRANPGVRDDGAQGTFSFDLANGGCGIVTGAQLLDGFLKSEVIDVGMLVTSDADPKPSASEGYDFTPAGGAVILEPGDDEEGFVAFRTETFPKYKDMFDARVVYVSSGKPGKGRNILRVTEKKAYLSRCVDCAQEVLEKFAHNLGLDLKNVDLVIPSQYPLGFPKKFRVRMGLRRSRVVDVSEEHGSLHTAGPIAALDGAIEDGRFAKARTVLFVTVGAGITVALALYCKEPEQQAIAEGLAVEEGEEDELRGILEEDEGDTDGSEG